MDNCLTDEMLAYEQLREARAKATSDRDRWRPWNVGGDQG
jgi:hypothetical protein